MQVEFNVNITAKDLFAFFINNFYRRFTGILWLLFSLFCLGVSIYTWGDIKIANSIILIVVASFYWIINPLMLYSKAKQQVKNNKYFSETLNYVVTERGIQVSQAGEQADVSWDEMWKAVRFGRLVVVYVTNIRAFILPVNCIGDEYNNFVDLALKGLDTRCHLRKKQ